MGWIVVEMEGVDWGEKEWGVCVMFGRCECVVWRVVLGWSGDVGGVVDGGVEMWVCMMYRV